jgi:hypothetical protein
MSWQVHCNQEKQPQNDSPRPGSESTLGCPQSTQDQSHWYTQSKDWSSVTPQWHMQCDDMIVTILQQMVNQLHGHWKQMVRVMNVTQQAPEGRLGKIRGSKQNPKRTPGESNHRHFYHLSTLMWCQQMSELTISGIVHQLMRELPMILMYLTWMGGTNPAMTMMESKLECLLEAHKSQKLQPEDGNHPNDT